MKLTLKLFLFLCLFCSVALADGEMGSGGEGEMGSGGKTCPTPNPCLTSDQGDTNGTGDSDSILTFIQNYLLTVFE
jgi:hypothetical protein